MNSRRECASKTRAEALTLPQVQPPGALALVGSQVRPKRERKREREAEGEEGRKRVEEVGRVGRVGRRKREEQLSRLQSKIRRAFGGDVQVEEKVGRLRERRRRPKASRIAPGTAPKYRTELARPQRCVRLAATQATRVTEPRFTCAPPPDRGRLPF